MNGDLDELDFWLLAAVDAGYAFGSGTIPLPLGDAGLEARIARILSLWKARMGFVDDMPWHRPAWLAALAAESPGVAPWPEDAV